MSVRSVIALQKASLSNEITSWINYFVKTILNAQMQAEVEIEFTLKKKFFDHYKINLSERQLKVVKRMLDEGVKGFEGGMNARIYLSSTNSSKASATRDLQDLIEKKGLIFLAEGEVQGRS